ncbi:hypothetical protein AJ85_02185 [Alkalihalobacillus alcalophilus ATCC 27647 = CGMCC 1.3604]|uniref:Capsule polysaccharide biosynthesis protein n=1 Tax=Alkalihalobacillus alcalophilus ATCC 27647 = CGMCC 1.3604 TaxID=1218173 RepID=A0A4S4JTX5_ALKAL|nr:polysaccharide synthesis/modification protein [Alkalihalobacillus alcalophilus]MED1562635.1 hypothetical protein [Alkalihalobacillus alcalophilus]THG88605.1 hypothetical protein AJ85_02185 [Alkalihalobacillus alcalophilus ATCC 27647 = CGMCC 1.3604]
MNVFFYGLSFMSIKNKYVGQPIFLKKIVDEFRRNHNDCFYLYRENITDLNIFDELKIEALQLPLKSHVETPFTEYKRFSKDEIEEIVEFDDRKTRRIHQVDKSHIYKHNVLRILENLKIYDEQYGIDMFIVWGAGYIPKTISYYAKKHQKKLIVMENGYFRPYTLMIDANGVNAENSVPRERAFYEQYPIEQDKYIKYLNRPYFAKVDDELSLLYKEGTVIQENDITTSEAKLNLEMSDYVFVPFQLETDSQIISHSAYIKEMKELVLYVLTAVLQYNQIHKKNIKIVFKAHPFFKNDGAALQLGAIKKICETYKEHCYFVSNGNTTDFIRDSKMVITINSTVGIEALKQYKNVITLGDAFYNIEGIVKHVTPTELIKDFERLIERKVHKELIMKFLYYLRFDYFAEIFYPDACQESVKQLVGKMLQINGMDIAIEEPQEINRSDHLDVHVKEIRFTKIGNMLLKFTYSKNDLNTPFNVYLRNEKLAIFHKLKPKDMTIHDEVELEYTVTTKQIFYQHPKFDQGVWEFVLVKDGENEATVLQWQQERVDLKKLTINGVLYNITVHHSFMTVEKNESRKEIAKSSIKDELEWQQFKGDYLLLEQPQVEPFSNYKLNVLYMPWIDRSTNGLIDIIEKRTDLNFIPFRFFIDVNEHKERTKVIAYTRENKNRIKAEMKNYLRTHFIDVDAVVVTLDWIAPIHLFIEVCKELELKTILIPHESVFAKREMYYVDYITGINRPVTDYVLAWGDLQKDIFSSRGYEREKIINIGSPKFDVYKDYQPFVAKQEYFEQIGFSVNKKTILFVMQPLDSQYNEKEARQAQHQMIDDLMKIINQNQFQLILRLPPALGEKLLDEPLLAKLAKCPDVYLEGYKDLPLEPMDAISHSDIVVSINSTMLFESALLNTPSLSIKYVEFESFWEKAGIPVAEHFEQLKNTLTHLIETKKHSLSKEGWEWAAKQLSDGGFEFDASVKVERVMDELLCGIVK